LAGNKVIQTPIP